jgi:hypothetical protein
MFFVCAGRKPADAISLGYMAPELAARAIDPNWCFCIP